MSKVRLANINSLTFYNGEVTTARRGRPIPQLTCVGRACKLYQPEVVRCTNIGGSGSDIEWKCEADLPEALRFGKVHVSCEGWSGPGDPNVLQGSCGLEYRLVEVPRVLRESEPHFPRRHHNTTDWAEIAFTTLFVGVLLFILYSFCKSTTGNNRMPRGPRRGQGPGFSSNSFPGGYDDNNDPPPPYTDSKQPQRPAEGWRPGFWTGLIAGGLADRFLFNNRRNDAPVRDSPRRQMWDWERPARPSSTFGQSTSGRRVWSSSDDDRGEGSSNLGTMRTSSSFGTSSVR
ncbi:hypothetical protein VNI00_005041 [Paramarasmius palmivorus]|uniref:Store-operated calcium entry-associated regulatory factor n=1 Tax=Paramarasmius palmivorus TaxID=297713 RepID=A0AAW0DJP5_9AGAR